ncbi:hypothetical protein Tco_0585781 [Tanacetum coccineum]
MQADRGEWSSTAQDDEYEYLLDTDSDATLLFSWSSDDAEDSNMDIDDEDFDKGYDTTAGFGGNLKVTSFLSGTYEVPFGTNVDVQATKFVLQELFKDAADLKMSSPPATTTHNFTTNPQQILIQAKAKKLVAKAKHNKLSSNFQKATMQNIWKALRENTRDLDSIWEETGQDYNFTQSGFKNVRTVPIDGVTIPCDSVRINKGRCHRNQDGV